TNLVRSGSAGVVPALTLEDGARVVPAWRFGQQLCMVVEPGAALAPEVTLTGRTLTGRIDPRWADRVTRVLASAAGGAGDAPVTDGSWTVVLPEVAPPSPGTQVSWRLRAHDRRGEPVDLLPAPGTIDTTGTGPMVIETDRTGRLRVAEWRLGAAADQVTVSTGGVLEVRGRVFGPAAANVRLLSRHKSTQVSGDEVSVRGGRFTASLELRHQRYRFGRWPLPTGNHEVQLEVDAGHGAGRVEVPLLVSATLSSQLPIPVHSDELEGRVARGPKGGVRLTLQRPLGEARTRYQENLLRRRGPSTSSLVRGVLMRSYFGEWATDNGLSIQKELQRRGSDLPVYWAVQDYSVPVPRGATPVIVNSEEWYRLVFNVEYYVDNMFQPDYHVKSGGQVLVETFHGYPFKQMGHPHWRNLQLSQARVDSYDRRTRDWDYLVSPARYATPLLTRDFGYRGEVLEIGYPRNDVLLSPDADRIRAATRASLGIGDGQIAVLYAPTFRDHLANRGEVAPMPDLLELAHTIQALGEDYCILVRGHAFNARSGSRIKDIPGCIEVTDYPEVSDLYLAADVAVVDYSSLRFDFGVTSKPMVFHVPDLERYKDGRGWLFDFEPTAPGPLCRTTDETVESLLHLDRVRDEYAAAYEAFRQDFLDLEDGRAGERLVDAIFVPRGDA
ncbi:MAG: CDP-glycerol glycerophosphotransferase family protein, partial [Marmoricola sp.]